MKLEIDSDKLLKKAMYRLHCRHSKRNRYPFWSTVADVFCIGSTHAGALCEWAGYDPDTAKMLEVTK